MKETIELEEKRINRAQAVILAVLIEENREMRGREIFEYQKRWPLLAGGYVWLYDLEEKGLVTSEQKSGRRRHYRATEAGQKALLKRVYSPPWTENGALFFALGAAAVLLGFLI